MPSDGFEYKRCIFVWKKNGTDGTDGRVTEPLTNHSVAQVWLTTPTVSPATWTAASKVPQYTHKRTFLTVGHYAIQKSELSVYREI